MMSIKDVLNNVVFLSVALLALGCSSDDDSNFTQVTEAPLAFVVTAEGLQDADDATRAAAITTDNITDMRLTGIKYLTTSSVDAASPSGYLYNNGVTKSGSWTLTGHAWPGKKENVQFFAYAPSVASSKGLSLSASSQTGVPSFTYTLPDNATNQQDVMVAASGELAGNLGTAIPLTFKHLCARVIVNIGDAGLNGTKTVTEVKFLNVCKTASYTFGASGFTNVGTLGNVTTGGISFSSSGNAGKQIGGESYTFMMLPQTLSTTTGSKATLSITYGGTTKTKVITGTWEAGKTYVYNISEAFTNNYSYTGSVQTFTVPATGTYKIECWGAAGGGNLKEGKAVANTDALGGYTKGEIDLIKGDKLYIYVGGVGADAKEKTIVSGGWNGGGQGHPDIEDNEAGGGGGGATDIRLVPASTTSNTTWKNTTSLRTRIMVAAGGGGTCYSRGTGGHTGQLGYAGGLTGGSSPIISGATQTAGYAFGEGAPAIYTGGTTAGSDIGSGGGGGGWYGGRAPGNVAEHDCDQEGSGGSSFISGHIGCNPVNSSGSHLGAYDGTNNKFTTYNSRTFQFKNTVMIDGGGHEWTTTSRGDFKAMPNPSGGDYASGKGRPGSGYARIALIGLP